MATGTVTWFNESMGYGFIAPNEGGDDVFVHSSGLADGQSSPTEGQTVSFDVEEGPKGLQASTVKAEE